MSRIRLGIVFGLVFGVIDVVIMVPMKFDTPRQKWEAMTAAFIERFMLGLLVPLVDLGVHPALSGLFLGAGLSVPSAIISRAYVPIVGIGVLGGLIMGFITKFLLG
jgi:hypothetical protein